MVGHLLPPQFHILQLHHTSSLYPLFVYLGTAAVALVTEVPMYIKYLKAFWMASVFYVSLIANNVRRDVILFNV